MLVCVSVVASTYILWVSPEISTSRIKVSNRAEVAPTMTRLTLNKVLCLAAQCLAPAVTTVTLGLNWDSTPSFLFFFIKRLASEAVFEEEVQGPCTITKRCISTMSSPCQPCKRKFLDVEYVHFQCEYLHTTLIGHISVDRYYQDPILQTRSFETVRGLVIAQCCYESTISSRSTIFGQLKYRATIPHDPRHGIRSYCICVS